MEVLSEDNECNGEEAFKSANLVQRVQKKVLSKLVSRGVVKHFVNDATTRLFDNLYKVLKCYYNKAVAEKVMKNLIKLVVKLGVVVRGEQLTVEQNNQLTAMQKQMHHLCLTTLSFGKVAYSYDRAHLLSLLNETHTKMIPLVASSLSEKSRKRLDMVFEHFQKDELLDGLFRVGGENAQELAQILADLEALLDSKDL